MTDKETALVEGKVKIKKTSIHDRLAEARKQAEEPRPKRATPIAESDPMDLMLDDSSSMRWNSSPEDSTPKEDYLRKAVELFASEVNFAITPPIHIMPFNSMSVIAPTTKDMVEWVNHTYNASGCTPMADSIAGLNRDNSKRGLLISDGDADSPERAIEMAKESAEMQKVIDCVHIGSSTNGEETLKKIAEITGGMYFKFSDLDSFRKSLQMLSPKKRNVLASADKKERLRLTGASEVS